MNNNSFSWHRFGMVAAYYYPNLKYQILAYPLIGLSMAVLGYLLLHVGIGFLFYAFISFLMSVIYTFSPLIFIRRSNRIFETMLPATSLEKSAFIIGYCLIFVTVALMGVYNLTSSALESIFGTPPFMEEINKAQHMMLDSWMYSIYSYISGLVGISTCMFAVFALRRNRMMAIVWTIVPLVVLTVLSIIAGFCFAFSEGVADAVNGAGAASEEELAARITDSLLKPLMISYFIITLLYTALMIWLTNRKISRIQI